MSALLTRLTSLGLWVGTCTLFTLSIASGNVILGAAMLCALVLFLVILAGPLVVAAIWLLGSPTVFPVGNQIISDLPFITLDRVMFGLLIGMLALQSIFRRHEPEPLTGLEKVILAFLAYMFVSLAANTSGATVRDDVWFFLQYAMPMLMFMAGRRMRWDESKLRLLLGALTVAAVVIALMGIGQKLLGLTIFTMEYRTGASGHESRASAMFANAETYIATLFILLSLTVYQFGAYRDALIRSILLGAMAVMLVGIVLGETRAPWGGAALGLLVILLHDRSVRPLLVTGGIVAAVAGAIVLFLMIDQLDSFMQRVTTLHTLATRLATWATALNMIAHNPVFGIGFGADAFLLAKSEYITGIGPLTQQYAVYLAVPHNEYLHVAVLLGVPGLVLFLCVLLGIVRSMFRIHADPACTPVHRRLAVYAAAAIVGLLFNSLFSDTYRQDYFWILACYLAGVVAGNALPAPSPTPAATGAGNVRPPAPRSIALVAPARGLASSGDARAEDAVRA